MKNMISLVDAIRIINITNSNAEVVIRVRNTVRVVAEIGTMERMLQFMSDGVKNTPVRACLGFTTALITPAEIETARENMQAFAYMLDAEDREGAVEGFRGTKANMTRYVEESKVILHLYGEE